MEYQYQISDEEDDEVMTNAPQAPATVYDESPVIPGTNLPIQSESAVRNEGSEEEKEEVTVAGPGKIEMEYEVGPADTTFMEEAHVAEPTVQISPLMTGFEEDPHSPKTPPARVSPSNYQSKLTDPTGEGGKEVDVDPILKRLDNIHIHNESQPHDHQISPNDNQAQPESVPRDTAPPVAEKISSDTVASKLGHGGGGGGGKKPVTEVAADDGQKVAEKVAGAESAAAERGVSVKEYLAEKLRPGEEDKALSEAITGRLYNKKSEGAEENKEAVSGGGGGGVVDRLKGAVGSWLGKSKGIGLSDGSVVVVEEEIGSEVKPQESGNDH